MASRMADLDVFEADAMQLAARKVVGGVCLSQDTSFLALALALTTGGFVVFPA